MGNLDTLEEKLGVRFKDQALLVRALTPPHTRQEESAHDNNHRLEFIGDAILQWVLTESLARAEPDASTPVLAVQLSALRSNATLKDIAVELNLGAYLQTEDGARMGDYRLEDAVEAIVAAVFYDQGFDAASALIGRLIFARRSDILEVRENPVQRLSVLVQRTHQCNPTYSYAYNPECVTAKVYAGKKCLAWGQGKDRKGAQSNAAMHGLRQLERRKTKA